MTRGAYTPAWLAWTSRRTPKHGVSVGPFSFLSPFRFFPLYFILFFIFQNLSITKYEQISDFE
jgi:hypothetical protein